MSGKNFMDYCKKQASAKYVMGANIVAAASCVAGHHMKKRGIIGEKTFDGIKKTAKGVVCGDLIWLGYNNFWYSVMQNVEKAADIFTDIVDTDYTVVDEEDKTE